MFNNLFEFYKSQEWETFRKVVIAERTKEDGFIYDEVTGRPIVKAYDIILHHKTELTEENVFDFNVSLNPDNIMIVSHKTHNIIHNKLGHKMRDVFLVYGPPCSGKRSWVDANRSEGDLIVDIDSIWQAVSGCNRYIKPNRLKAVVFKTRDALIDAVKYRLGKWTNAYIIGGYPLQSERERISRELGAREIFIEATAEECLQKWQEDEERKKIPEFEQYIAEWFRNYTPPR